VLHGKEGVDGSSPSEGFKIPANAGFLLPRLLQRSVLTGQLHRRDARLAELRADLANLVNEASLTAARRNHSAVEQADFTDSLERILLGAERKVVMTEADRRRTAYHGGWPRDGRDADPGRTRVRKVWIIPRGSALGVTFSAPDSDRFNYLEPEIRAKIKVSLGGRAAEEVVFGDISTGAESDIDQLTALARQMVGR
jgi:cell division protease FtsH